MTQSDGDPESIRDNGAGGYCGDQHPQGDPKLELRDRPGSLPNDPVQSNDSVGYIVSIKAYRCRLLDEDNICEKYHIDALRYAGIIPEDDPGTVRIKTSQSKVSKKCYEKIQIRVRKLK